MENWDLTLGQRTEALSSASAEVASRAHQMADAISRQTKDLREASEDAGGLVDTLKKQTRRVGTEDFLRRAAFISEGLQSLAVDMNRLMETQISEEDWKRFNRGEKGVFVRKLLGFREKAKLAAINQRCQEDAEFRDYVNRYLAQFGTLLQEAKKRDHDAVLSTTFLSSDMGKLYMLLARALGRDIARAAKRTFLTSGRPLQLGYLAPRDSGD